MAILESLGLAVSVVINGTPVAEYDDLEPDQAVRKEFPGAQIVTKYIESQDDTEYEIRCEALPTHQWLPTSRDNVLTCMVEIDGKHQAGHALTAAKWNRGIVRHIDGVIRKLTASQGTLSKFKFSAVNAVDDANARTVKEHLKLAKHLGLIRVKIYRGVDLHKLRASSRTVEVNEDRKLSIAEKALKGRAVSHGTTYSPATKVRVSDTMGIRYLDEEPYVVFDFQYKSRDALRSEMIIPRTVSPSPVPSFGGLEVLDDLSQEDINRLAKERLAEIKNERVVKNESPGRKREFGQAFIPGAFRVARNVRPKREGPDVKRDAAPVFIDLTDD